MFNSHNHLTQSSIRTRRSARKSRSGRSDFVETLERRALLAAVASVSPSSFGLNVGVNAAVKVTFASTMNRSSITSSTFQLLDSNNNVITGRIAYNADNNTAIFDAASPLQYGQTYHTLVKGGAGGVLDSNAGTMANDVSWSFTTAADPNAGSGGPILVVTSSANPYSKYYAEILRAEGLNEFATADIGGLTSTLLSSYSVVILGEMSLTSAQVTTLTNWVTAGGNLIAMKPDAQLASLLGLTSTGNTASNTYIKINTSSGPGVGITGDTMQYHGSANLYALNGATSLATLYSTATTATSNPAVTLRSVGSNGGQAAAFAYDLAKSVISTRQGNPAWAGQERDGSSPVRSDDMFFGNSASDPQPDWVDMSKVQIPQADEQQRLLANMIGKMNLDVMPLPRFWYLPNGNKAVIIMTGDDHNAGLGDGSGTPGRWTQFVNDGTSGGQNIYGTSYIVDAGSASDSVLAQYAALGFEPALHVEILDGSGVARNWTSYADLNNLYLTELSAFENLYPSLGAPKTNRTHAIVWSDWDSQPQVEYSYNIRLDTTYYYWPGSWVQDRPGMFTGSGMPMRFAKADGTMIDVYQAATELTDENLATMPYHVNTLLNNALGSLGYYGAFTVNAHTDLANSTYSDAVIASAKAHNVPVVSAQQMMNWLDGRNGSSFSAMSWNNTLKTLNFTITLAENSAGLQAMVPVRGNGNLKLSGITVGGNSVAFTKQTIKGVEYAFFNAANGAVVASYAADTTAPTVSGTSPANNATNLPVTAAPSVTFSEDVVPGSITFLVRDAANVTVVGTTSYDPATNTAIFTPTNPLNPGVTYTVTVSGAQDGAGNTMAGPSSFSFSTRANTPQTIWSSGATPVIANSPDSAVEVGVKFRSDVAGMITGIRFYKGSQNTGTHIGSLWTSTGTLLGQATFINESDSGWQDVVFATPISISANTTYVASYHASVGNYSVDPAYFANGGVDNVYLHAFGDGVNGGNGVFKYGASSVFPDQSFNANNFWVDVDFTPQVGDTTAPTVSGQTPAPNSSNILPGTAVSATFSEGVQSSTISMVLKDAANNIVAGSVNYNAATLVVTFTPSSQLAALTMYTMTISGAKDGAGNTMAPVSWSFTTAASGDIVPPTITSQSPASGATSVALASTISVVFSEAIQSSTISMVLTSPTGATVAGTVSYNSTTRTATFTPSAALRYHTTYNMTVSGTRDTAGNTMVPVTWSFTTLALTGATIWPSTQVPAGADSDTNRIEVGTKFIPNINGTVTGIRFYKYSVNTGTHVGHLWSLTGTLLATVTFTGETSSGWQQMNFSTPVAVTAGTTYVISYYAPNGRYATNSGYFNNSFTSSNGVLTAPSTTASGGNGVYRYINGGGFPNQTFNGENYWVDVLFSSSLNSDTTAPTVSTRSPASGATGVSTGATISATFSEAVQAATISMILKDAANNTIAGTVAYDSTTRTATFTPSSALSASTTYTITLSGAKDLSGNTMTSTNWSFTTAGAADTTQPTITAQSPASGATGVAVSTTVSATFSEAVQSGTISMILKDSANNTIAGTVSYNSSTNTATFTPTSSLGGSTTYTMTVSGAKDLSGNTMTSTSWSFTTGIVDVTPPTISSRSPASGATGVAVSSVITVTFSEAVQSGTISMILKDASNNTIAGGVTYNSATNTATFTPSSALAYSTVYTMTVSGTKDAAGNTMTSDAWSFTTAAVPSSVTIWGSSTVPGTPASSDTGAVELGVKFRSSASGFITGIRFYKGSGNGGTHVAHLWTSAGVLLATGTFQSETATGWQQVDFTTPVAISANTTYVASYFAPQGHYAADGAYFASTGVTSSPVTALANGVDGGNGVYIYGASGGFPNQTFNSTNYWVDVVYSATGPVDTTAPSIAAQSPASGATGVATTAVVTATFNEAVQSGTISMILKDASNNTIAGAVSYNSGTNTATFTPTAALSLGTTYTMTVSGAKDIAGNTMTSTSWSFTTAATSTITIWSDTTIPSNPADSDASALEVGVKIRSSVSGYITGIRFYKGSGNGGTHVGHLWSSTGTLLATVTFQTESATGWQTATFSNPVAINANTTYVASYYAPQGHYAATASYFASTGASNGSVTALANGVDGGNGVFFYGAGGGFPNLSYNSTNYWVDVVFTTTPPVDNTPPSIAAQSPASGATGVATTSTISAVFSEAVPSGTISMILKDASNNTIAGTVSYNGGTNTATFTPTASLSLNTTYTMTVSGAKDTAGNTMTTTSWSFTTSAVDTVSIWSNSVVPTTPADADSSAVELGVKIRSSVSGYITAIKFYKGSGNGGTHLGHLWSSSGTLLATVTFQNETATGWQTAVLSNPVAISANTTYVVSYFAPQGHYAVDAAYFASSGATNGPLTALANGVDGGNGVFFYGPSGGFPNQTFNSGNYWVDAVFTTTPPVDNTPPTITTQTPASGATGEATGATISATFSEAVQSGTITMILKDASNNTVAGTVSYNSSTNVATFTPTAALSLNTTYTMTVSGAKDTAGNTMTSTSWSFTTQAAPVYSVWDNSATPQVLADTDPNPIEVGMKFQVSTAGYITGVKFYKGTGNGGTHIGHLWSSTGTLLATVTFQNETSSGWQTALFSTPVAVSAGQTYIVSYYAPLGHYSATSNYFATSTSSGPITALANGTDGGNGVFFYGAGGGFPNASFGSANYWVDVIFTTAV